MKRADFIEHWIVALESGQWRQAKKKLYKHTSRGDSYCCLGVACQLANMIAGKHNDLTLASDWSELLPKSMEKFLGIPSDGSFKEAIQHNGKTYHTLTELNDDGVRFKTIAKIIREQMKNKNFEKVG